MQQLIARTTPPDFGRVLVAVGQVFASLRASQIAGEQLTAALALSGKQDEPDDVHVRVAELLLSTVPRLPGDVLATVHDSKPGSVTFRTPGGVDVTCSCIPGNKPEMKLHVCFNRDSVRCGERLVAAILVASHRLSNVDTTPDGLCVVST